MEERYLTVSALTKYIKYKFDHDHHLEDVLLEGEISNFKHHSRGHFYFTLKDDGASISATMFSTYASKVKFDLKDGMKVYVKGKVTVYEAAGSYQINVVELKSDGIGDLYLAYEKLKKELEQQGYFNPLHKKPIPKYPKTIGVITSPTGAAIRDIINTINRRYPLANVILYPAIVQGVDAKESVAKQINKANKDNLVDVLIVGRGGGSIEDLWAFNEKIVATAIYESEIPIISAVGHEVDFTIADFVADIRAATPTAAAELATPNIDVLNKNISFYIDTMNKKMKYIFSEYKMRLSQSDKRLDINNPIAKLNREKDKINVNVNRLNTNINHIIELKRNLFDHYKSLLEEKNPLAIMSKGYSINKVNNIIITDVNKIKKGDKLETVMANGKIISEVIEVCENGK